MPTQPLSHNWFSSSLQQQGTICAALCSLTPSTRNGQDGAVRPTLTFSFKAKNSGMLLRRTFSRTNDPRGALVLFALDMGATAATVEDGFTLTRFLHAAIGKDFALELEQRPGTRIALITRATPIVTPTTTGTQWHASKK